MWHPVSKHGILIIYSSDFSYFKNTNKQKMAFEQEPVYYIHCT